MDDKPSIDMNRNGAPRCRPGVAGRAGTIGRGVASRAIGRDAAPRTDIKQPLPHACGAAVGVGPQPVECRHSGLR